MQLRAIALKKGCKIDLPVAYRDPQPDGTTITFHQIPLPFRRKPLVSASPPFRTVTVPLDKVSASQRSVTDVGLCKSSKGLPLAYAERDGTFTIGDGHHRVVKALLRGQKRLKMRIVNAE